MSPAPFVRLARRYATLAALAPISVLGCGGGGADAPAATNDSGVVDTGADSPADAGPDVGFSLAPGEVVEVAIDGTTASVRLATPAGNERFVAIVGSTRFDRSTKQLPYSFSFDPLEGAAAPKLLTGCSLGTDPWKSTPPPAETAPTGTAPAIGTVRTLQVSTSSGTQSIQAKVIAVGTSSVVWADVTPEHPANLDDAFVSAFLAEYDATILPRERAIFGVESDLDHDGHVGLVFTPLTHDTAVAFFLGCDLLSSLAGCDTGNAGEMIYLTPPDVIDPPYNTPAAMKEILAHETSHLIHFNRKVLRNKLSDWTDSGYMDEGIGGFAQDVIGYQAGNFYVTMAALDGINTFSLGDVLVDGAPYDTKRDGVLRGGGYLFVRWFYDRAGGDVARTDGGIDGKGGPSLMRALLDAPASVAKTLPTVSGAAIGELGMDFYTTIAMSNRDEHGEAKVVNPCFSYLPAVDDPVTGKSRGADVFASFHGMAMKGPAVQTSDKIDGAIRAGGVEYVQIGAVAGQPEVDVTLTIDAAAPAAAGEVLVP